MKNNIRFIGPRRRLFQWATTLLLLLIPWREINENSLLRIDIPGLNLYIFGQVLRIQELYLVLLATLIFITGFLLITVVLGRVWCGWLCPQTTLSDVAEWFARRLGLAIRHNNLRGPVWRQLLLQLIYILLAFLVAANLLWYFIPPLQFFSRLKAFDLHYATWITLIVTCLLVYLDLAVIRRLLCSDFCPYGRIQTSLVDKATLTLHLPDTELKRCIECDSCVRACPMEIDIRHGYQVECTDCGRCLDACRKIMAKRNEPGLIRYTFGQHGEGLKGLLNQRILLLTAASSILVLVFIFALIGKPVATVKVAVSHTAASRLLDNGHIGTFFNAWINNRSQKAEMFSLQARKKESGVPLVLKGQIQTELAAGANRRLDFVLVTSTNESLTVEFLLMNKEGMVLSVAEANIEKTEIGMTP